MVPCQIPEPVSADGSSSSLDGNRDSTFRGLECNIECGGCSVVAANRVQDWSILAIRRSVQGPSSPHMPGVFERMRSFSLRICARPKQQQRNCTGHDGYVYISIVCRHTNITVGEDSARAHGASELRWSDFIGYLVKISVNIIPLCVATHFPQPSGCAFSAVWKYMPADPRCCSFPTTNHIHNSFAWLPPPTEPQRTT